MNTDIEPTSQMRPAGFWIRVLANIIDTIVALIITMPLLVGIYGGESLTSQELIQGPAHFLISYVFPAVATILFWIWLGATPGKLLCGIRVIDRETGDTLVLWQGILRYLGYFISLLPLFLGFIWVAFDARKQGFHDKLARTMVVWKNR